MKTEKLYLNDMNSAYNINFNAKVLTIEENKIVLDRTLFYPLGGGQNWDTGILSTQNGEIEVIEVRGRDVIEHYVSIITNYLLAIM